MEMQKVPEAGYEIRGLWISGLQRTLKLKNFLFPVKLLSSLWKSRTIIRKFQPDVAIGTGGYASAPLLRVASNKKIPCILQEQNGHAGITNKWLSKKARTICVAYEGMDRFFPANKIVLTGNPVRQDLLDVSNKRNDAMSFFQLNPERKTILILGGSLGAKRVNELIARSLPFFNNENVQLIWQCGSFYIEQYKNSATENVKVHAFLNRMDLAYAAADVIISRSGALSVSELCLVGKPVIFIPSPNVAEDHQTKNAQAIATKEAAILLKESELNDRFESVFSELLNNEDYKSKLAKNIKALARPNATKDIVAEIKKLLD